MLLVLRPRVELSQFESNVWSIQAQPKLDTCKPKFDLNPNHTWTDPTPAQTQNFKCRSLGSGQVFRFMGLVCLSNDARFQSEYNYINTWTVYIHVCIQYNALPSSILGIQSPTPLWPQFYTVIKTESLSLIYRQTSPTQISLLVWLSHVGSRLLAPQFRKMRGRPSQDDDLMM